MSIVQSIVQQHDKRTIHLALSLAGMLEKRPPPTFADETPVAGWAEAVDRLTVELIKQLGRSDGISAAISAMHDLVVAESQARTLLPECPPDANVWLVLLEWAKGAKDLQRHHQGELTVVKAHMADLERRLGQATLQNDALAAAVKVFEERNVFLEGSKPKGHTDSSGVRIIDMGDDD